MTSDLPLIAVLYSRETKGMSHPQDMAVNPLEIVTFQDAFSRRWEEDAHFCTYYPSINQPPDAPWPRINKPMLPHLRSMKSAVFPDGLDLHTRLMVLDYDNPNKAKWTPGLLSTFMEQLNTLADSWDTAFAFSLFYTTRHGARFVYVLDQPVPVDHAEQHHQWLCNEFCARGMKVDTGVSDWTRIFRLPWVIRDGQPTWDELDPPMEVIRQYDARLPVRSMGFSEVKFTRNKDGIAAPIIPINEPMPDPETARDLIETMGKSGKYSHTTWYRTAKNRLQGRECFPYAFEDKTIDGNRNTSLTNYVGQAIGLLGQVPGTTPAHVFALFMPAAAQMEPDAGTRDWLATLWDIILRIWSRDEAKAAGILAQVEAGLETKEAMYRSMAKGMYKWAKIPLLQYADYPNNSPEFDDLCIWLSRRLICSTPSGFTILLPNGYYDRVELKRHQLVMHWRISGMDMVSSSRVPKADGSGYRDITADQLMNTHGFVVTEVSGRSCMEGAIIERIDTESPELVMPLFSRNEYLLHSAEFDEDVDKWLHQFFGDNFDEAMKWIAWALAFEEGPIAAMSIRGGAGAGKKMFIQGLAECLTLPALADAEDIVGNYGYGLLRSPFLWVNEGWPPATNGSNPADKFRHLVGGDPNVVQRKFMSPIVVKNPMRVIFTANNMNIIRGLVGNRDLSPDDRQALFDRIIHYDIGQQASHWLSGRGNKAFTAAPGRRWIQGDSGEPSDYIVAKHFMWLYKNRGPAAPGSRDRLLVMGGTNPEVMFDMRTNSGRSPLVIETILKMLDALAYNTKGDFGMTVEDGRIYVLGGAIIDFARSVEVSAIRSLTTQQVSSVLKGLVRFETETKELESRIALGRRRWHELDIGLLKSVADRDGLICKALDKMTEPKVQMLADRIARLSA